MVVALGVVTDAASVVGVIVVAVATGPVVNVVVVVSCLLWLLYFSSHLLELVSLLSNAAVMMEFVDALSIYSFSDGLIIAYVECSMSADCALVFLVIILVLVLSLSLLSKIVIVIFIVVVIYIVIVIVIGLS